MHRVIITLAFQWNVKRKRSKRIKVLDFVVFNTDSIFFLFFHRCCNFSGGHCVRSVPQILYCFHSCIFTSSLSSLHPAFTDVSFYITTSNIAFTLPLFFVLFKCWPKLDLSLKDGFFLPWSWIFHCHSFYVVFLFSYIFPL